MYVRALVGVAMAIGLTFGAQENVRAQELTRVVAAYGSTSIQNSPIWIAKEQGFFEDHGLDVELVRLTGARITTGLLSGSANFISSSASSPFLATLSGGDAIVVGVMLGNIPYDLVVDDSIDEFEDLKGKVGAVLLRGDLTDIGTRLLLSSQGIDVDSDVTLVQGVGTDAERIAALVAGSINFTVVQADFRADYEEAGFRRLLNALDVEGSEFIMSGVFTTRSYADENPEVVKSYVAAIGDAMEFMKSHKDETVAIVAQYSDRDPAKVEPYWEFYAGIMQDSPFFTVDVINASLRGLAIGKPDSVSEGLDPAPFYDDSFVRELQEEGYFEG